MKHKIQLSGKGVVFLFILSVPAELVLSSTDRDTDREASINREGLILSVGKEKF